MRSLLLDTSVLIGYSRGAASCRDLIDARDPSRRQMTHLFCQAELLAGARDARELRVLTSFVDQFRILLPSEADLLGSVAMLRGHLLRDGVDWNDCVIAATAIRIGADVATCNVKHFRCFPGLSIVPVP